MDDKNPATLKVEAAYSGGGCDPSESTRFITRAISSSVSTISPNNNCFASNANEVTFTLKDYPSGSKFTWTVPAGWTDNNDSLATCKTQPSASAHLYDSILVAVKGCESSVAKAYVSVKPGNANAITGATFCIEKDSTYSFSTTATTPAADTYEWNLGTGWTNISTSNGGLTVTATATGAAISDSIKVTPKGIGGCDGGYKAHAISFPPALPTGITVSKSCINAGLPDQITLTAATTGTTDFFDWDLGGLGTITGNDSARIITVNTPGFDDNYSVSVRAYTNNSVCSFSNSFIDTISIVKENFTVTESVIVPPINSVYFTYPSADWVANHSFEWIYNGNNVTNTTYPYSTNQTAFGLLSRTDSTFYVTVTNLTTGCVTRRTAGVGGFRSGSIVNQDLVFNNESAMSISPNPTDSKLTVTLSKKDNINIWIVNASGSIMKNWMNQPSTTTLDVADLLAGNYIIVVYQGKQRYSKQFIKK